MPYSNYFLFNKKSNWFIVFVSLYRTISGRWVIQVLVDLALKYIMIELVIEMLHRWLTMMTLHALRFGTLSLFRYNFATVSCGFPFSIPDMICVLVLQKTPYCIYVFLLLLLLCGLKMNLIYYLLLFDFDFFGSLIGKVMVL